VLIYHFMFGPSYADGCPVNSSIADAFDSLIPHLKARDVSLIARRLETEIILIGADNQRHD